MKKTMIGFYGAAAVVAVMLAAMFVPGCSSVSDANTAANIGAPGSSSKGGSMARFTINGDYLYTVNERQLTVLSLADPAKPVDVEEIYVGTDIETIFSLGDLLFIGSQGAMYIYDVSHPEFPERLSVTSHLRSCDPVVAADTLAFVTLNSSLGSWCGQSRDVLQVYDISDLENPVIIDQVDLSSPRGLAVDIDQRIVFVCDNGLKAYDFTDPRDLGGLYTTAAVAGVGRIDAYDCIVLKADENYDKDRLLVIGADGLYQLAYDRDKFSFISKIDLRPQEQ